MKLAVDTVIPGNCEMNIHAETIYSYLWEHRGHWITEPQVIGETILVARTMVADRPKEVVLRVANVGNDPVSINKWMDICEVEECEHAEAETGQGWMSTIIKDIPSSVSAYYVDTLTLIEPRFSKHVNNQWGGG